MHERRAERAELQRMLLNGASVQMFAPRRIGKTWLMRKLEKDLRRAGWTVVFVDVEGMRTQDEVLRELCKKLERAGDAANRALTHLGQRLKQLMQDGWQGNPLHAIGKIDFASFSEALIAALDEKGGRSVIMVDELALFLADQIAKDADAARAFLYQLRRLRQEHQNVRWLMTGSIGLDVVARRAGLLGALVDLKSFILEPFDGPAARSFVEGLCDAGEVPKPFAFAAGAFEYLLAELGWSAPFYLTTVADRVQPTGVTTGKLPSATPADIERAFVDLMRPEYRTMFSPFEEHIEKNFPPAETRRLKALLAAACQAARGETAATLLASLAGAEPEIGAQALNDSLTALANAGLLMIEEERWRFRSGLVRRYWLRYHST
jgi:hypothetical protein